MIKLIATIALISFFLISCTEREEKGKIEFVRLDKISMNIDLKKEYLFSGSYFERISFCDFNMSINEYFISFYRKNPCTSYFLDNEQNRYHQIAGDEQAGGCEGELKMLFYHRSETNPHMWYSSYPDDFKDTVYCDCVVPAALPTYKESTSKTTKEYPQPCKRSYLNTFCYKSVSKDSLTWYNDVSGDTLYCSQIVE